jgi:DNA-binding MarR family transcriptional regulator
MLCILATTGPRGMTELAGLLGVEKAALTGLADRAERRGLLARAPSATDRRAVSVSLTDAGRDAALAFHRDVSAQLSALTAVLPEEERLMFCRSVARICASQPGDTRGGDTPEGAQ